VADPFDGPTGQAARALARRRGDHAGLERLTTARRNLARAAPFNCQSSPDLELLEVDAKDGR
jgi:hypothetical protein